MVPPDAFEGDDGEQSEAGDGVHDGRAGAFDAACDVAGADEVVFVHGLSGQGSHVVLEVFGFTIMLCWQECKYPSPVKDRTQG